MIRNDFRAHLAAAAPIKAIVANRIYPRVLPQDALLPALVYRKISGVRDDDFDGATGLADVRMQVDVIAASEIASDELAEQVRLALSGFTGTMGSTEIYNCTLSNETDFYDSDTLYYRVAMDFTLTHKEPTS